MINAPRAFLPTALLLTLLVGCRTQNEGHSAPMEAGPSAPVEAPTPKIEPPKAVESPKTINYESIVSDPTRSTADRALDQGRHPAELLEFYGVKPGMRVAELAAGGGYTAELLARTVGPSGKVFGQNSPFILKRFAEGPWTERLKGPAMKQVERVDSEMDAPLVGHQSDLDAVFMILFYHDTVWFGTERARMNEAIFAALKPGGFFGVVDHSAASGAGVSQAKSLHRIEESALIEEVTAAGFVLEKSGNFLRNPDDQRDWSASPSQAGERRGESDRFALLFRKPQDRDAEPKASSADQSKPIVCEEPRSEVCTKEFRPVCATVDTGVRCIKAPCPSTQKRTVGNGCMACADAQVQSYVPGPCQEPEGSKDSKSNAHAP